ncbi:MAG: DUF362 domain-containing protein [Puniceicoccaceae bacterium]
MTLRHCLIVLSLLHAALSAGADPGEVLRTPEPAFLYEEADGPLDYDRAVSLLLAEWESTYEPIRPGATGKVVLKIYTNSGLGLRTPPELVLALARALEERGFAREDIALADLKESRLRAAGYLPPVSRGGDRFEGLPVIALDDPALFHPDWFYDSPLPPHQPAAAGAAAEAEAGLRAGDEDRKSFLPTPLLFDLDFWINLPVAVEHPVLGLTGAVANAGLWTVSNHSRFFNRPVSAASSAVEIAAIPELRRTALFSILSLETHQIIGGPRFNSHYTHSRPEVLLGNDPLLLDRYALAAINAGRLERGFDPISPEPLFFRYGESLELGDADLDPGRIRLVSPGSGESAE